MTTSVSAAAAAADEDDDTTSDEERRLFERRVAIPDVLQNMFEGRVVLHDIAVRCQIDDAHACCDELLINVNEALDRMKRPYTPTSAVSMREFESMLSVRAEYARSLLCTIPESHEHTTQAQERLTELRDMINRLRKAESFLRRMQQEIERTRLHAEEHFGSSMHDDGDSDVVEELCGMVQALHTDSDGESRRYSEDPALCSTGTQVFSDDGE